jgi:histidinol-phosphatase (PHP family)
MSEFFMQLKVDVHMHSDNSADGKSTLDEMCKTAVAKGFEVICFTEHFDMNVKDRGYKLYDHERHLDDINRSRDRFDGKIEILKGIEFSEPHLYPFEFEKISVKILK